MASGKRKHVIRAAIIVGVLVVIGLFAWQLLQPKGYGPGIATGNGRIEATEINVSTKLAGRIAEILVNEGDFVEPGQAVARMDTKTLDAQLHEAEANVLKSQSALQTAISAVAQSKSDQSAQEAVVRQRLAELSVAQKTFHRSDVLNRRGAISDQQLDQDRASMQSNHAALGTAQSQVAAAKAAVNSALSQVNEAQAGIKAAEASVERYQSDIDDSVLKADRIARVQYKVAEPGEVLGAGGVVLNLLDLKDVYLTFFLPTDQAGQVHLGEDVHLILDALPKYVIPAKVTFVASEAQFTPKTVETADERAKLMFRIKANLAPELLSKHLKAIKTGLPGVAYVKLDQDAEWPEGLEANVAP